MYAIKYSQLLSPHHAKVIHSNSHAKMDLATSETLVELSKRDSLKFKYIIIKMAKVRSCRFLIKRKMPFGLAAFNTVHEMDIYLQDRAVPLSACCRQNLSKSLIIRNKRFSYMYETRCQFLIRDILGAPLHSYAYNSSASKKTTTNIIQYIVKCKIVCKKNNQSLVLSGNRNVGILLFPLNTNDSIYLNMVCIKSKDTANVYNAVKCFFG